MLFENPTSILYVIIGFVVFEFLLTKILKFLNKKFQPESLPENLTSIYDEKKYEKSLRYETAKYNFSFFTSIFSFAVMIGLLVFGVFGKLYDYVATFGLGSFFTTMVFFGILFIVQLIVSLPTSYYSTFVIEEKFGFNTMTKKIFFMDSLKSFVLGGTLGFLIIGAIVLIYEYTGMYFWLLAWGVMTFFSVFMMMFYSSLIVPIFNKQTPLEEGKLRTEIEKFATQVGFQLDNIFVIDGSRRSSKANAYFSGFGPKKRIVLYDTLIEDLSVEELVAVLAHEIGHYKKKHTLQMLFFGTLQTGIMFFVLGLLLKYEVFSQALGATGKSFAVGVIAFSVLYTPISMIFGILGSVFSRKNEYEADSYAAENYKPKELKNALIKLSRKNLSNLTPHPAYEFFYYSHPSVLKRIAVLEKYEKEHETGILSKIKGFFG